MPPKLGQRAVAHVGAVLWDGMVIIVVIFRRHAPQASAGNYRAAVTKTRIDRARHGEFHGRRHILQAGVRRPGRDESLVIGRRLVAEQQIIAKDKSHRPGHIVHDRGHSIKISMIADKQHSPAFFHKTKHRGHIIRAVTGIHGCFDDQHVALAERLVVDFVRLQAAATFRNTAPGNRKSRHSCTRRFRRTT